MGSGKEESLYLTVQDRRYARATLRHQKKVMCDAVRNLELACTLGEHYGVLITFERASHKWTDAIGTLTTIVELTGNGPKEWIRDAYMTIDDILNEDITVIVNQINKIALPLMKRLIKVYDLYLGNQEIFTLNQSVSRKRKDVLMERIRHYRTTWRVSEHDYDTDQLPQYEVPSLVKNDGSTFYGDDAVPDSPVEALNACNARIHRLYESLLEHVCILAPHAMILKNFNDRLNVNRHIISNLMFGGTRNADSTRKNAG